MVRLEKKRKQKEPGFVPGRQQRARLPETSSTVTAQEVIPVVANWFLCGLRQSLT